MRKVDLYWDMAITFDAFEAGIRNHLFEDAYGYAEYLREDYCSGIYVYPSEYKSGGAPEWATGVVWHRTSD
jgi:hypothetical protein